MAMLDNIVKLITVYPNWATFLMFVCFSILAALLVLVVRARAAKKLACEVQNDIAQQSHVFMKLKPIQLFPDDPAAEINVVVSVNGIEFVYPSATEMQWMPASSSMDEKIIAFPCAEMYYIRFEINFSSEKKLEGGPLLVRGAALKKDVKKDASQSVTFPVLPLVDEYKLYLLQDGSRDTSVKAVISYEIYVE